MWTGRRRSATRETSEASVGGSLVATLHATELLAWEHPGHPTLRHALPHAAHSHHGVCSLRSTHTHHVSHAAVAARGLAACGRAAHGAGTHCWAWAHHPHLARRLTAHLHVAHLHATHGTHLHATHGWLRLHGRRVRAEAGERRLAAASQARRASRVASGSGLREPEGRPVISAALRRATLRRGWRRSTKWIKGRFRSCRLRLGCIPHAQQVKGITCGCRGRGGGSGRRWGHRA
mmetsp:Transcript_44014/g.113795  ORF Transcript_44014/g.113795 Transcript_44014/m.113795 type:complete len:234 (+) Transcript_44014:353-1054(+)